MKLIQNIGKEFIDGEGKDVRISLKKAFQVGASTQEACAFAGVPLATYEDWEYTHKCISDIKACMYSYKLDNYTDITESMIEEYNLNIELISKLIKNPTYGLDVYKLIDTNNKVKAELSIYHLTNIYSPKRKKDIDWKASAWFLERTNPDRYGKNPTTDDDEIVVDKITVEFVDPSKDETRQRLEKLEQEVKESIKVA